MTNLELLDILGDIKGAYILQAQALRSGEKKAVIRKLSRKRTLLIAAVISLLLLLVGCAAAIVYLQKANLGHVEFSDALWMNGTPYEKDVLSLSGYMDSPQYRAMQEWINFENSYDMDGTLLKKADADNYIAPPDYDSYLCYTDEMCAKIDELCGKYNLSLAGPTYFPATTDEVLDAVAVSSIENPALGGMVPLNTGLFYRSGSFRLDGSLEHRFASRDNVDTVNFVYMCSKKNVFFTTYLTTDDIATFDSWEFTAWDGTKLLLAQNKERGLIFADTEDYFTSIVLYFSLSETKEINNPGLRKDMEEIADSFAYALHPREPEAQWLKYPNIVVSQMDAYDTFDTYFARWMPGSLGSSWYSPDYQQKFVDLDGDGIDEMLIWNVRTGVVYEIVSRADGVRCIYGYGNYADDITLRPMYLCAGNILEKDCSDPQGGPQYEYYRIQDSQLVLVETVMKRYDGKFYWSEAGGASSLFWTEITEAEYDAVREKYSRIKEGVDSAVPVTLVKNAWEDDLLRVLMDRKVFYNADFGKEYYLTAYCREIGDKIDLPVFVTRYTFVDMDADGIQEAVVDFRYGQNTEVACMVLRADGGTVFGEEFYYRQLYQLKADGTFAWSGSSSNNGWARLQWGDNNRWICEPAENGEGRADVQWYSYPLTADMHEDSSFTLFREVFLPTAESTEPVTVYQMKTLCESKGFYFYVPYENSFIVTMPGSTVTGTLENGFVTNMVYTLYLDPIDTGADPYGYTLEVGVEQLNKDTHSYFIYRPHTTPIAAPGGDVLAEYINWHRVHPRDQYTNWDSSLIIY